MNVSSEKKDGKELFVDTATNEALVAVYEQNVRFNFGLKAGERAIYLDAMKRRNMNIDKYRGDLELPSGYSEPFAGEVAKLKPTFRERLMEKLGG